MIKVRRDGRGLAVVALCALVASPVVADGTSLPVSPPSPPSPSATTATTATGSSDFQADGASAPSLSLDQAVSEGLARDPGIRASDYDLVAARAKALDALFHMLPSIGLSSGYTALSTESSSGLATLIGDMIGEDAILANGNTSAEAQLQKIESDLQSFANAPTDSKDIRLDLQYPVFAGFRVMEGAGIAKLGVTGKEAGLELAKRMMAFQIEKTYWEAERATAGVKTLQKSLELEGVLRDEMKSMAAQGMVTDAELLGEQARYNQAALALDEAKSGQALAFLGLASLVGDANATKVPDPNGYRLVTAPGSRTWSDPGSDPAALVAKALADRPEAKLAQVGLDIGKKAKAVARGDLMPTVLLTGNLVYSDPDPRAFPPTDSWSLTWMAGIRVRYDLGALPGALAREKAASADLDKAQADFERQRDAIAMDVRKSVLALSKAKDSLDLTKILVAQAQENLRVTQARFDNGLAKHSDLLQAQIGLLRVDFAVENKTIDLEEAQADLDRAIGR